MSDKNLNGEKYTYLVRTFSSSSTPTMDQENHEAEQHASASSLIVTHSTGILVKPPQASEVLRPDSSDSSVSKEPDGIECEKLEGAERAQSNVYNLVELAPSTAISSFSVNMQHISEESLNPILPSDLGPPASVRANIQASNAPQLSPSEQGKTLVIVRSEAEAELQSTASVDQRALNRTEVLTNPMNYEEMDENLALMDPENPLLKRVQDALLKQLTNAKQQLELEIREKEEALRKAKDTRETVGVELYSAQQQLRIFQEQLAQLENQLQSSHASRENAEVDTQVARDTFEREKKSIEDHEKTLLARKRELEMLTRTQAQLEQFSEELKSKLITTRRVTVKSEEDLLRHEAEKRKQDFQLHQLSERLSALEEQGLILDRQIEYQKNEIQSSKATLQEANLEMEALLFEKRQLLHQWKAGLLGLQRRQEVLSELDSFVAQERETSQSMEQELNGFKKTIETMKSENETLDLLNEKLKNEANRLEDQVHQTHERKDELKLQYSTLQTALEHHEYDLKQLQISRQCILNEVNAFKKQWIVAQQKSAKLEKEIEEQIQIQQGIDKGMVGTSKDVKKLIQLIHEKENEVAMNENQVASTKLDCASIAHWIDQLKHQIRELDEVINEKNGMIEKYELELRRGNDEMTKKQSEIDLMNKKLSHILTHSTGEALGPLEATIHNLTKLVTSKEKEEWDLQQFWLKNQNELVQLTKSSGELSETISTMKMRLTILTRKKQMLNQDFDAQEKEIKYHLRNIKALQNEMTKINVLLSKQVTVQTQLEENNLGLEQEFRYRLKEAELASLRLEQKIRDLKVEKEEALLNLIDAERQIMLWEKKIQLAKETREALDPNIGAQEIKEMKMEIHRMELRLSNLQKLQEKLIKEMEKGVVRRETIATRSKLRGKGYTQATLNKLIMDLNKKLKMTLSDLRDLDQDSLTLHQAQEALNKQISETQNNIQLLQNRQQLLMEDVQMKLDEKTMILNEMVLMQKKSKRYQNMKEGKYHLSKDDPDDIRAEFQKANENLSKVEKAVEMLMAEKGPQLGGVVDTLQSHFASARQFVSGH